MTANNGTKPIGPTALCAHIARVISGETGVWFGPMDIANALARGLCGRPLAIGQPVSMMLTLSSSNNGLRASPNRLAEVVAALNAWAETDRVTEAIVHTALTEVMRLSCGAIVVTVSTRGELGIETAQSLAELMKRRAVATLRQRA